MNSLHLILQKSQIVISSGNGFEKIEDKKYKVKFRLPILKAFSIEYFIIHEGALNFTFPNNFSNKDLSCILDNEIIQIETVFDEFEKGYLAVTIFYHGIRDYLELFYWVEKKELRHRLGEYYKEAEKNFNSGAYLSFLLMCGAIFEGILEAKGISGKFNDKIETALKSKTIEKSTSEIMHKIRKLRNIIHGNNYGLSYPTITDFMDTRKELDNLINYFG